MKRYVFWIAICIGLAILFYPTISNSNSTGSPGGKTGSPTDGTSCTGCHYAGLGTGATITTDIPSTGYVPGNIYTITTNVNQSGITQFGFEVTAEKGNSGSAKTGTFLVTSAETKLTNNNTAITHKPGGTSGNNSKSWSMDWEAPNTGTGDVTFFGSFIAANGDGTNSGDTYHSTTLSVNEDISTNSINDLSRKDDFIFNTRSKTIETQKTVDVYDISGKLVLTTNRDLTNITHLKNGIYILKSFEKTQKIILN